MLADAEFVKKFVWLKKLHLSSFVQWIVKISLTGALQISTFIRTRQWIYQDLHSGVEWHRGLPVNCYLEGKPTGKAYLN